MIPLHPIPAAPISTGGVSNSRSSPRTACRKSSSDAGVFTRPVRTIAPDSSTHAALICVPPMSSPSSPPAAGFDPPMTAFRKTQESSRCQAVSDIGSDLMTAAASYFEKTIALLGEVRDRELAVIEQAAEICAARIAHGGLVFLFGNGHPRLMCEGMSPRQGCCPCFVATVELAPSKP